ncbi:hypothetical protein [Beijerinckia mobilis]|uniref:hypothetical protein n=1 Tax=Beijerinckia mobilis TaxID=231434 RepID=UPI0012EC8BE6|nr:hypothetical protein [Beijerinckia mobilis]
MVPDDDMKELRNELRGQLPIDEIKEYANQRSALMYSIVLIGVFFIVIAISFLLDRLG